jgi:hypothetical protein
MRDLINGRTRHGRIDEARRGASIAAALLLAAFLVLFVLALLGEAASELVRGR